MIRLTPVFFTAFWFALGILLSSLLPLPWPFAAGISLLFAGAVFCFRPFFRKHPFLLSAVFLVWGLAYPAEILKSRDRIDSSLASGVAAVRFVVVSEPARTPSGFSHMMVRIRELDGRPVRLRASCFSSGLPEVRPGWIVEGIGVLERNDSRSSLGRGSYGDLDLRFVSGVTPRRSFGTILSDIRAFVRKTVVRGLPPEPAAVITGLMLGLSPSMPVRVQESFSNSGTMHLLAVSGLHLGIIAAAVFFLIRLFVPQRTGGLIILAVVVLLYALLIGERASIMRAALMTEIGILVWLLDRDKNYWNIIGLSALILLLYNPFFLFQIGFQLSFSAVAGLFAFQPFFLKVFGWLPESLRPPEDGGGRWRRFFGGLHRFLRDNAAVSFAAQLPVVPLVLVYFHKAVFVAVFANLAAVPLSGAAIIAGFLSVFSGALGLWPLTDLINRFNGILLRALFLWTDFFGRVVYFRSEDPGILLPAGLALGVAAFFIAVNLPQRRRLVWGFLTAAVLFSGASVLVPKPLAKAVILSAGNAADIVIVRMPGRDLLFLDADSGKVERNLRSFMMIRSVRTFDQVFLLSGEKRARQGLMSLLTNRDPRWPPARVVHASDRPDSLPEGVSFRSLPASGILWATNGVSVRRTRSGLFVLSAGTNALVIEPRYQAGPVFDAPRARVLYRGRSSQWYDEGETRWPDPLMTVVDPEVVIVKKNRSRRLPVWKGRVANLIKTRETAVAFYPDRMTVKERSW